MPKRQPYYDKEGKQISAQRWTEYLADPDYPVMKYTQLDTGIKVITRWTGVDHSYTGRSKNQKGPRIYETEVIGRTELNRRYTTLYGATRGHSLIVNKLNAEQSV